MYRHLALRHFICPETSLWKAEVGMNGPFSKESEYLNCNDRLTDRYQKRMNSTAGQFPVSSPRLLHFSVSLVVPKRPGRLQHFSFPSVICFLFRVKGNWFWVTQKTKEEVPSCLQRFGFYLGWRGRILEDRRYEIFQLFPCLLFGAKCNHHLWWRFTQVWIECKNRFLVILYVLMGLG